MVRVQAPIRVNRSLRATFVAAVAALLLTAPAAFAQSPLPSNAEQAIARGQALMQEALATYDAQFPDRPLWQQAFREGRNAVQLAPGHPEPLRFLAEAYSRSNWPGPAVATWNDYVAAGGTLEGEARELFLRDGNEVAFAAYQQGNLEEAAERYLAVASAVPDDVEAHRWLGRILLELGLPQQATAAWQTVVDLDPTDDGARYFLNLSRAQTRWGAEAANAFYRGVAAYEAGDLTTARSAFAQASARNANYAEAWAWLGRVAFEQGNYEDAFNAYSRASELEPGNTTYSWFRQESQRLMSGGTPDESGPPAEEDDEG